jgi:hypothetical protein
VWVGEDERVTLFSSSPHVLPSLRDTKLRLINIFLGNADDPIELIQKYEEEFFRKSKLFRYEYYLYISLSIFLLFKVMEFLKRRRRPHVI